MFFSNHKKKHESGSVFLEKESLAVRDLLLGICAKVATSHLGLSSSTVNACARLESP